MATRIRRWRTPEECVAALRLDAMGLIVLTIALSVSGLILGLMLRVISG
jgi:hypothetical protein